MATTQAMLSQMDDKSKDLRILYFELETVIFLHNKGNVPSCMSS